MVVIRNAAGADDQGLINPILKRYLGGACSLNVREGALSTVHDT